MSLSAIFFLDLKGKVCNIFIEFIEMKVICLLKNKLFVFHIFSFNLSIEKKIRFIIGRTCVQQCIYAPNPSSDWAWHTRTAARYLQTIIHRLKPDIIIAIGHTHLHHSVFDRVTSFGTAHESKANPTDSYSGEMLDPGKLFLQNKSYWIHDDWRGTIEIAQPINCAIVFHLGLSNTTLCLAIAW